jgi:uncharacterized protein YbjT (DUF2867 family)
LVLIAGATGYVGSRLVEALERSGWSLRCLARRPEFLKPRVAPGTEVVKGDVFDPASLRAAMEGVDAAYYLVHSMASGDRFEARDRDGAHTFAAAAREQGVRRMIYLGGLGAGKALSTHLASRQEVGQILRESGVPTIEFRASIIIGSGSLSFEMVRALVEKLPAMITPRWVSTPAQPIAIEDVIAYLLAALDIELEGSDVFEIGGADRVSYMGIMREYARQRGLRRMMIPVPLLTPWLSSLWLGLVTPIYARVGRRLIEGVRNETVVRSDAAQKAFEVKPRGIAEAIGEAIGNEDQEMAQTRWSDALSSRPQEQSWGGEKFGSRLVDSSSLHVPVEPSKAFRPLERIGGTTGWYYANWLWQLRGLMDLVFGGVGMRRGRRDPDRLLPGDTVDCWRVEALEGDRLLRLFSEMKLPGRAWLQFEVDGDGSSSTIRQTAIFDPVGLMGLVYWYGLYPIHRAIYRGMLRGIAKAAKS